MKKINVSFGGGYDSILFSVKENRFFSYEKNREELHSRFGGLQYYSSQTGMTGQGFLKPEADHDLIPFGYYRTDCKGTEQSKAIVHMVDDMPIFGYAPIVSHGGIDHRYPFVLTDGTKVALVLGYEVKETLLNWGGVKGKELKLSFFNPRRYGGEEEINFEFYNPSHFHGVRITRFINLQYPRDVAKGKLGPTIFEQKLNIIGPSEETSNCWFHRNIDGYFDQKWSEDPRNIGGEITGNWLGAGDGLFWRRNSNGVEAFMEIERFSLNGGKYVVEEKTSQWLDYEQNFSVLEWFSQEIDTWKAYFMAKLTKKARHDYVYARQRQKGEIDTKRLMELNADIKICIQDSLDSGNCRPGTEAFIKRFEIKHDECGCCFVGDLLKNKKIEEMLQNFSFQKVVHQKLVDPDKEIPLLEKMSRVKYRDDEEELDEEIDD